MRPHPESGRHYYFRPTEKKTGAPLSLTEETIRQHLVGEITVGLYAINPSTQRCKWVAIDADYKNALEDLLKLQYYLWQDKVEPALEMSKRGGHLWILLETPLLAKDCRIYIHDLATRLGVPVKGSGLGDGIEIFPRHNAIGDGEFGNAIRSPLRVHRGASRRYWFYGADYTLEAQMAYLNRLRKLTAVEVQAFIAGKEMPVSASERRLDSKSAMERPGAERPDRNSGFLITSARCERSAGTSLVATRPARRPAMTAVRITWPYSSKTPARRKNELALRNPGQLSCSSCIGRKGHYHDRIILTWARCGDPRCIGGTGKSEPVSSVLPITPCSRRLGRARLDRHCRKRVQHGTWISAAEQLPDRRWGEAMDHHRGRPVGNDSAVARGILTIEVVAPRARAQTC
jgi:hypothetical protein